jgi:molybdenum cofactor cytidylyltransferase
MPDPPHQLAALVLAAGRSSRLGTSKQLLRFRGQTLLRRSAEAALSVSCHPVVVVLGAQADQMMPELNHLSVRPVVNPHWQRGIGSSIRHGVAQIAAFAEVDACMILLCDQPLLTAQSLRQLIQAFAASGKAICAASYGGTIGPPVIASRRYFPALMALPDDEGAKRLWVDQPDELVTVPLPEAEADIDTARDRERVTGGP